MKKLFFYSALIYVLACFAAERPATWAVKMERAGLPNLHRVDAAVLEYCPGTAETKKHR